MNRRTFVLGVGTAAAGGSVLLGSGSFSASESQRTSRVETVGDERAYLVLQYPDVSFGCEGTVTLLTLTNQFTEPVTDIQAEVSVVDSTSDISLDNIGTPDSLDIGETGEVTADAVCEVSGSATETVSIDIDARGEESFVAAADRSLEVSCDCGN